MEIEKKFQIKKLPDNLEAYPKKEIEQGYLCTRPVVRIRKSNERYILTYKSGVSPEAESNVRVSQELEAELTQEGYYHLREKADHYLIQKTRYIIPLPSGHTGELDVFHGRLDGLYFIEVEFADEEDALHDERFSNSFLSRCENLDVFK